jgi:hypothetical protein
VTFSSGAVLRVLSVDQSGGAVSVGEADLAYSGVWDQTAGAVTVGSEDRINFTGAGDSFAGTLGGSGTIAFLNGSDTLAGTTLSATTAIINGPAVTLSGEIDLTHTLEATTANLVVGSGGATLQGGGTVVLSNRSSNRVYGQTDPATLTNVDDRLYGAGQFGDGEMALVNDAAGLIDGDDATALVIDTGTATIQNAGIIDSTFTGGTTIESPIDNTFLLAARGAGTLTLAGAVTGDGEVRISGATVDVESSFNQDVDFSGSTGTVEFAHSQSYTGTIIGFSESGGTSLDLADIPYISGTTSWGYSGTTASGVLTVKEGSAVASIKLQGDYLSSTFTLSSDGHGGTGVVDPAAPTWTARFASAMAAFAPTPTNALALADEPAPLPRLGLVAPRFVQA